MVCYHVLMLTDLAQLYDAQYEVLGILSVPTVAPALSSIPYGRRAYIRDLGKRLLTLVL